MGGIQVMSDSFDGLFLQETGESSLAAPRQFADFIQEEGAPMAVSMSSLALDNGRPVKAPFSWTEKSLSKRCRDAPQLMATKGSVLAELRR